jgi:hypothetical protein
MVTMEIRDNSIWAKHLKADRRLHEKVLTLNETQVLRLSVDGIEGDWQRMRTGKDGRPTPGIKPVGKMAAVWKRWQARRGEKVVVKLAEDETDPLLQIADRTFQEWYTAEDEEAFGELRPV